MPAHNKGRILIVDDEPNAICGLTAILLEEGYEVITANNAEDAGRVVKKGDIDAVITDFKLPGSDGMRLFDYIDEAKPDVPVVFLTSCGTIESAVAAMSRGAFYYLVKPPDYQKLKGILARAVEQHRLKMEIDLLKGRLANDTNGYSIVGDTPELRRVFDTIDAVKDSMSTVLMSGEPGTGKELIARTLHYRSAKSTMPFISVNCSAIPKELIEVELFGCEKGAFAGAISRRMGKFEEAVNGVLFFDEMSELALPVQEKLLGVLDTLEIERIGGSRKIKVPFRLISATSRDLSSEVRKGRFREDLYARISMVQIHVPPLRHRQNDIPLLAMAFLSECCARQGRLVTLSHEVLKTLQLYQWPGNIRQLKNVIERAFVLARGGQIGFRELPAEIITVRKQPDQNSSPRTLKELEIRAIRETLHECRGNKSKTAKILGISRKAFYKRLREADRPEAL
ncbi:MAG: sigma-54-dependent Fis family transcriptional regulator [Thermodesulfovibrio sp.]|nr:sigma-54-dependent Fis family transcriptional regulator [Thermodesulfovibrio sp.]